MSNIKPSAMPTASLTEHGQTLVCAGEWTIETIPKIYAQLNRVGPKTTIDLSQVTQLDSMGALELQQLIQRLRKIHRDLKIITLLDQHQVIFDMVGNQLSQIQKPLVSPERLSFLEVIGSKTIHFVKQAFEFFAFIGEIASLLGRQCLDPRRIQWRSVLKIIETSGCQALIIVAMTIFLIGVVLVYQLGVQLRMYGATIYVVDATGIAMLREFSPMITAIIIAGRTSTSFAALIGAMMVNQEVDALLTMGESPKERLVLPRLLGMLIVLPLLVVWANLFGILGAMIMAKSMLHINYFSFLQRFQAQVGLKEYVLGIVKTPVFALVIAGVGCFQGFQVKLSAESVGQRTTQAAVQSIFLIIILDAFFSIVYNWLGF